MKKQERDWMVGHASVAAQVWSKFCDKGRNVYTGPDVSTGFGSLDALCDGFQKGTLAVLAARPAMGASSLVATMVSFALLKQKVRVLILAAGQRPEVIENNLLANAARIPRHCLNSAEFADETGCEVEALFDAMKRMRHAHLWFSTFPLHALPERLGEHLRELHEEVRPDLIVLDAPGLEPLVPHIATILKSIALDLSVAVLCTARVGRAVDRRADHQPCLADLRNEDYEAVADTVLLLHRDDYYHPDSAEKGLARVRVARSPWAMPGEVRLRFLGEYAAFEEIGQGGDAADAG